METLQLDLTKRYTFADYRTWDNKRREIIDGKVYEYQFGNPPIHQNVLSGVMQQFYQFVKKTQLSNVYILKCPVSRKYATNR